MAVVVTTTTVGAASGAASASGAAAAAAAASGGIANAIVPDARITIPQDWGQVHDHQQAANTGRTRISIPSNWLRR